VRSERTCAASWPWEASCDLAASVLVTERCPAGHETDLPACAGCAVDLQQMGDGCPVCGADVSLTVRDLTPGRPVLIQGQLDIFGGVA